MCNRLTLFLVILSLLCSCEPNYEKRTFNFSVETIKLPQPKATVYPELVPGEEYQSSLFKIMDDSLMFSSSIYNGGKNAFMVSEIGTADTLMSMVRRGRGPGEVLRPSPYLYFSEGHAHFIDMMTGKYYDLNVRESLRLGHEHYDSIVSLTSDNTFVNYTDIAFVGKDSLLCFDSCTPAKDIENGLTGIPYFALLNVSDGSHITRYEVFNEVPLVPKPSYKSLIQSFSAFHGCSDRASNMYCFAMVRFPQINFLDCTTGKVHGLRFKNGPKASMKNPYSCFQSICTDGKKIYALYMGVKMQERAAASTKLLVMSWGSSDIDVYDLGGPYFTFDVSSDNLFLAREGEVGKLYSLPLSELK